MNQPPPPALATRVGLRRTTPLNGHENDTGPARRAPFESRRRRAPAEVAQSGDSNPFHHRLALGFSRAGERSRLDVFEAVAAFVANDFVSQLGELGAVSLHDRLPAMLR